MDYQSIIEEQQKTEAEKLAEQNEKGERDLFNTVNTKEHQKWLNDPETVTLLYNLNRYKQDLAMQAAQYAMKNDQAMTTCRMISHKTVETIIINIYGRNRD